MAQVHRADEYHSSGLLHIGRQVGVLLGVHRALGSGDVTGGLDKFCKLRVGDFSGIHPKARYVNAQARLLFRIYLVTRSKLSCRYPDHAGALGLGKLLQGFALHILRLLPKLKPGHANKKQANHRHAHCHRFVPSTHQGFSCTNRRIHP